ncbi:hypothetical protein [Crassaminicella profunda]|uniref:hypothetical protein n=1 Tax=Crassaminicella profunda TaxID=1286698 RepID=UPI001CA6F6DF|nr:hypothetical protein [Crassaminicella profunda]QZY56824.1 hypothetical protein K7H06_07855 [Crassaminicella profunda]
MTKYLGLFLKIILILVIFSILLPQLVDHVMNMFTIQERNDPPRGNSTFVAKMYIEESSFKENFFQILKCMMK